jgi:hypothetical protein
MEILLFYSMNSVQMFAILSVLTVCVIVTGCTDQNPQSTRVPEQTTAPDATPLPTTPLPTTLPAPEMTKNTSLFDQPVTRPPEDLSVSVSVQKDPIYSTITATFDGGKGQDLVQAVLVKTTLSTGNVSEEILGKNKGDEIRIAGTRGGDRIQVGVTYMNGQSYLITDAILGQSRAPEQISTPVPKKTMSTSEEGLYGGPVTNPPNSLSVSVDVKKDPIYRVITGTFRGGHGQFLLSRIDMYVVLGTGEAVTKQIAGNIGATAEVQGSDGIDRVQIVAYFKNGDSYKILEKSFGSRG